MKRNPQGIRIVWLVRTLTGIGLIAVLLSTGLDGWTLATVRRERALASVEKAQLDATSKVLIDRTAQYESRVVGLLDEAVAVPSQDNIDAGLTEFVLSLSRQKADFGVQLPLDRLTPLMVQLAALSERAFTWRRDYDRVWDDLRDQRTMGLARDLIFQLRSKVEILEGRRRLDRAIRYRRWREASGEDANRQAQSILTDNALQQRKGENDFKSDLVECARLVELLGGEEQADNLADLSENKLKPVLDRLSLTTVNFVAESAEAAAIPPRSIDDLKAVLFGPANGNANATDLGLFALRRDVLRLRQEREALQRLEAGLFLETEVANNAFAQAAQLRTEALGQKMEMQLSSGWWQMLIICASCSALFLWLAWMISSAIRNQVGVIESAKLEAETGRQTAQGLMLDLRKLQQDHELILNSMGEGIHRIDRDGKIVYENPASARMLGWSVKELIGLPGHVTMHYGRADGSAFPKEECAIFTTLQTGQQRRVVGEVFWRKDGTSFPVEYTTTPIRGEKDEVLGAIVVFADVTERKKAEQAAEMFQSLVDRSTDPIHMISPRENWRLKYVNDAACRHFGLSREKLLTMGVADFDPNFSERDLSQLWEKVKSGEPTLFETRHKLADGRVIPVEVSISYFKFAGEEFTAGWFHDITGRKHVEMVLRDSEEKFRQFAENITDVFWMMSVDMKTAHYVSPAFEHIWGLPVQGIYADPHLWVNSILPEDREHVFLTFLNLNRQPSISAEYRIKRPDGSIRWIHDRGFQVLDTEGKPYRTAGIAADITERKQAEAKLETAQHQLLSLSRQAGMAEVASSVLHNAGNVLNSINVSATLVTEKVKESRLSGLGKVATLLKEQEGRLPLFFESDPRGRKLPEYFLMLATYWQQEQAAIIGELKSLNENIQHVKDIIAMQQSLTGISGIKEPARISHVVQNALGIVSASFKHNGIVVTTDFEDLPPSLVEKSKILQILVNLLQNANDAMSALPASGRKVAIKTRLAAATCTISVSDSGIGLQPEDLTRIFSFGFTTKPTGHGIGLHVSALSAKDMDGTLRATSEGPGKGATFILAIPFNAIESRP